MSLILNITSSERASLRKLLQAVRPQPWFLTTASCIFPSCQSWHLLLSHYFAHLFPDLPLQTVSIPWQQNVTHLYPHRGKESRREEGRESSVCGSESAVTMEMVITVKSLCWMVHITEPGEWMLEMMEPKDATAVERYWAVFIKAS